MFKQVADVRTADTLNLPTPEMEYHIENVEATEFQKLLVQELSDRADEVQGGNIDPSIDNMLRITSDGRMSLSLLSHKLRDIFIIYMLSY